MAGFTSIGHQRDVTIAESTIGSNGWYPWPMRIDGASLHEQVLTDFVRRDPNGIVSIEIDLNNWAILLSPFMYF
jgi:hypothetical protein